MPFPAAGDELSPAFALSVFNEPDSTDVTLNVHTPENPRIRQHASMGLLYGLAVMVLDRKGVIADMVDELLMAGPINEVDAVNRITILLDEDANELPA